MGVIVGVYYAPGGRPPALPAVVYVLFAEYTGPAWHSKHPLVIPIIPRSASCEYRCCDRRMTPLICAAACTIHKLQGLTVG